MDDSFTPQVDATLTPFLGREFDSEEEARNFYNTYARACGFSMRISCRRISKKDGKILSRCFVCSREGFRAKKWENVPKKRARAITRQGCKAMIKVSTTNTGKWVVTRFEEKHVHEMMTPIRADILPSQRNVSGTKKQLFDKWNRSRTNVVGECGGVDEVGCTEEDTRNSIQKIRQEAYGRDAQLILDYFKRMQSKNSSFYYAVQVDEKNCMTNCFWVDARSRMAYHQFGDVVLFDTTYKANKYLVPFAPFTGVNHHQQYVVFGCALLVDETEESLIWLFQTWVEAMSWRPPQTIIAHEDPAMRAAIAKVFPETHHKFCVWHILQKVPDKLAYVYRKYNTFKQDFNDCIHLPETGEEFDRCWESLVTMYDLKENELLEMMYKIREKWVPAYLKDIFLAEISTIQHCENIKSLFDGYVSKQTTLQDFIVQYEKAIEKRFGKESEADFQALSTKPLLKTTLHIEKHAADIYTRMVFLKFQDEIWKSLTYGVTKVEDNGVESKYMVENFAQPNNNPSKYWVENFDQQDRSHIVTLAPAEKKASCKCLKFEFAGILCRHILAVFRAANICQLPSHYILKRWTRHAKIGILRDASGTEIQEDSEKSLTMRYDELCQLANKYVERAAISPHAYNVAKHSLERCLEEIPDKEERTAKSQQLTGPNHLLAQDVSASKETQSTIPVNSLTILNPDTVNTKGREHNAKTKNTTEMAQKNTKKCKHCGRAGHDKRMCSKWKGEGEFSHIDSDINVSMDGHLLPPSLTGSVSSPRMGSRSNYSHMTSGSGGAVSFLTMGPQSNYSQMGDNRSQSFLYLGSQEEAGNLIHHLFS